MPTVAERIGGCVRGRGRDHSHRRWQGWIRDTQYWRVSNDYFSFKVVKEDIKCKSNLRDRNLMMALECEFKGVSSKIWRKMKIFTTS